jgi:hypothetical protein
VRRLVFAIGWVWLLGPLASITFQLWTDFHMPFLSFEYYIVSWSSLMFLALCGAWFLIGMPGAKWVLRAAAVLVALYTLLIALLTEGGASVAICASVAAILLFCVATIAIANRRAA